jgi:hypothetical protein
MKHLTALLPPEARWLITWAETVTGRARRDDGDIGIVGTVILVVGFAIAAGVLVTAINGKLQSWISQIP